MTRGQRKHEHGRNECEQTDVNKYSWTQHFLTYIRLSQTFGNRTTGGVTDKPLVVIHFVHNLITDIDTGPTTNTHVLQAFANIDTRRTHLHTETAVNTVAHTSLFVIDTTRATTTWLASYVVITNDKGVVVDHYTLEACIRAHVFTDSFTQKTCIAPCSNRVKHQPKPLPWTEA